MNFTPLNHRIRLTLIIGFVLAAIAFFGFVVPSLLGFLLTLGVAHVVLQWRRMRRRADALALNAALRRVCDRDGSIQSLLAAGTSGSLAVECYQFAKRLEFGQEIVSAANRSGIPLEIATAVAMRAKIPDSTEQSQFGLIKSEHSESIQEDIEGPMLAIAGQSVHESSIQARHAYVLATLLICCCLIGLIGLFVVPTMNKMSEAFGQTLVDKLPADFHVLAIVILISALMLWWNAPAIGKWLGRLVGREKALSVKMAYENSEILVGLAAAMRRSLPVSEALSIAAETTQDAKLRRAIQDAISLISQGTRPADAFAKVGWIGGEQRDRLAASSGDRAAQLLDRYAVDAVRDSMFRLRWWTAITHPIIVCCIGLFVAIYAFWILRNLTQMIEYLSA